MQLGDVHGIDAMQGSEATPVPCPPTTNPAVKRGCSDRTIWRETSVRIKGWKAGEGIRTLDIHVGNVTLYH